MVTGNRNRAYAGGSIPTTGPSTNPGSHNSVNISGNDNSGTAGGTDTGNNNRRHVSIRETPATSVAPAPPPKP